MSSPNAFNAHLAPIVLQPLFNQPENAKLAIIALLEAYRLLKGPALTAHILIIKVVRP